MQRLTAQEATNETYIRETTEGGMAVMNTKGGPKVVNERLNPDAQGQIDQVINSMQGGQQVKAVYEVSSNGKELLCKIDQINI